jgi:hypothetical protein
MVITGSGYHALSLGSDFLLYLLFCHVAVFDATGTQT